jgi:hypothetical protein
MAIHARIGPSSLKATKLCPGRVRVNENAGKVTTYFAAEGTLLHDIAENCIEQDFEPADYIGQKRRVDGHDIEVTAEMAESMIDALDWIREQPGTPYVETQVKLDPWMPGQFGTLDLAILDTNPSTGKVRLTVFDWKFGIGLVVPIVGNYQLQAYALGFIETVLKPQGIIPDEILLIIEQPRAFSKAPRYYEPWTLTYEELLPFGDEMAAIMRAADRPDAPRIAGREQCFMCAAASPGGCVEFDKFHFDLLGVVTLPEYELLSPERRAILIQNQSMIQSWLKAIMAQAIESAVAGDPPPGLKAIEGDQGDRFWGNAEMAEKLMKATLAASAFTQKLLSPAQVESVAKPTRTKVGHPELWKELQELVSRKPSKPQLVLASDPRPSIQTVEFDDLD